MYSHFQFVCSSHLLSKSWNQYNRVDFYQKGVHIKNGAAGRFLAWAQAQEPGKWLGSWTDTICITIVEILSSLMGYEAYELDFICLRCHARQIILFIRLTSSLQVSFFRILYSQIKSPLLDVRYILLYFVDRYCCCCAWTSLHYMKEMQCPTAIAFFVYIHILYQRSCHIIKLYITPHCIYRHKFLQSLHLNNHTMMLTTSLIKYMYRIFPLIGLCSIF